jgi:hypothetical protein
VEIKASNKLQTLCHGGGIPGGGETQSVTKTMGGNLAKRARKTISLAPLMINDDLGKDLSIILALAHKLNLLIRRKLLSDCLGLSSPPK